MVSTRLLLLAAACALSLSTIACGDSDGSIVPEGAHHGYVVSSLLMPVDQDQARMYGLDLGASKSSTPDDIVDNRLGEAFGILDTMGLAIQPRLETAIIEGGIILLVDFQTKDFMNASAAGLSVTFGTNPVPAACTDANDRICGHHLTGTAMFSIASDSPKDELIAGEIVNGTFNGGPGDLSLQISFGTPQPITLRLVNARAKATAITDTGMTALLGGALTVNDLNTQILPVIQAQVAEIVALQCAGATPPNCTCTSGDPTGMNLLTLFDTGTKDCKISLEEITGNPVVQFLLAPDICSSKACTAPDSLSLGIKITTVKATFPM